MAIKNIIYKLRDTYIERVAKESPNDRNDRAIRAACAWYKNHLKGEVDVVLLTNDIDNMKKAKADKLNALTSKNLIILIITVGLSRFF